MSKNDIADSFNAGPFSLWLRNTRAGKDADVPCGSCNACCRSSYFIQIRADEKTALQAIPQVVRFPAPGNTASQVMGYDEQGHCPMLQQGRCRIYAMRPQTCREYDCRIFAACGIEAGGAEKQAVNTRVAQWRFEYPNPQDEAEQQALRTAVEFIQLHRAALSLDQGTLHPTQLALLAIEVFEVFLPEQSLAEHDKIVHIRRIFERASNS